MRRPASGTVQWSKVGHRVLVALACAFLLLDLGLLGMHVIGFRLFPTRGDSMEPASSAGSMLIARMTAAEDVRVSDFIVFPQALQSLPFTAHRVAAVIAAREQVVAITKGDNNFLADPEPVTLDVPVARVVLAIPRVGWFMSPEIVWCLWVFITLLGLSIALLYLAELGATMVLTPELR